MVKILFIFMFSIFALEAYALKAVVIAYEAPMFATPDETTKVIQYTRKGDHLYVHNKELKGSAASDEHLIENYNLLKNHYPDPLFKKEKLLQKKINSKFYKTLTKTGQEAYILKEHVMLEAEDSSEKLKKISHFDNTDYRIPEPLRAGYPLLKDSGYKGLFTFGLGRPTFSPYSYTQKIRDAGYNFGKEVSFIWSKADNVDDRQRFYFGAKGSLYSGQTSYLLDTMKSTQNNLRFSIGPYAGYDAFRDHKQAICLNMALQFIVYDQMEVAIESQALKAGDTREFNSPLGFSLNLNGNYQLFNALKYFDFILGANINLIGPRVYSTSEAAQQPSLWASDEYHQPFNIELNYFTGIQSYY